VSGNSVANQPPRRIGRGDGRWWRGLDYLLPVPAETGNALLCGLRIGSLASFGAKVPARRFTGKIGLDAPYVGSR